MAAYLSTSDADTLAATVLGMASYTAASSGDKAKALLQASDEIDQAMRYQGRQYDPTQAREFPRVAYNSGYVPVPPPPGIDPQILADTIWDWDATAEEAIVPPAVEMAVLRQADYLLAGTRDALVQQANSGLASQSVGGMSESYKQMGVGSQGSGVELLCVEARALMERYRLRSGSMK